MIRIRSAADRGHVKHGWLESWHSFSFGDYQDSRWQSYGALRVFNEDRVAPRAGFPPHSHRDMEIISYVLSGALRHRDSTGGGSVVHHGEVQLMSAGRGISHSEMNDSNDAPVHFLQIWIEPRRRAVAPGYQQKRVGTAALEAGFAVVAAPAGEGAPLQIEQDARLWLAWPRGGQRLAQALEHGRRYYLHVASGAAAVAGQPLSAGDAALIEQQEGLELTVQSDAELLLLDLG